MPDRRRLQNRALMLPLFGAALILPPVIGVFQRSETLLGVPLSVVYLFGVWVMLIVATAIVSPRLRDPADPNPAGKETPGDGS